MRCVWYLTLLSWPATTTGQSTVSGLNWSVDYTADYVSNFSGGLARGGVYLGNLDVIIELDGAQIWGLEGNSVFLYGLNNHGGSPGSLVGDAQGLDNIEAPAAWRLYEAWIEQTFGSSKFSLLAGLYDLNSEFDVIDSGGLFINSSHGIGLDLSQSGQNGPSIFPVTSLGLRLRWTPRPDIYIQAVVMDGVPGDPERPKNNIPHWDKSDGLLLVAEAGYIRVPHGAGVRRFDDNGYSFKVALGYWQNTSEIPPLLAGDGATNQGAYVLIDKSILRESDSGIQGMNMFFRFGVAESSLNRFGSYVGGGVVYSGLFNGRGDDQIGFGVAVGTNGDPFRNAAKNHGVATDLRETGFEFAYQAVISESASVQIDLQYIINPDMNPSTNNAFAGIMRWVFSL